MIWVDPWRQDLLAPLVAVCLSEVAACRRHRLNNGPLA